jgi:hypothetical protein
MSSNSRRSRGGGARPVNPIHNASSATINPQLLRPVSLSFSISLTKLTMRKSNGSVAMQPSPTPILQDGPSDIEAPASGASTPPEITPNRKRLRDLLANPPRRQSAKKRKETHQGVNTTLTAAESLLIESDETLFRKLDVEIRWDTFQFHSNKFAKHLIQRVYGNDVDVQGDIYQAARNKVFDNVKSYKNKMLAAFDVSSLSIRFLHVNHKVTSVLGTYKDCD